MARGVIARMVRDRGFGFIKVDGSLKGADIFFHHSAFPRGVFDTLREGQLLSFDIEKDKQGRGERALNIEIL